MTKDPSQHSPCQLDAREGTRPQPPGASGAPPVAASSNGGGEVYVALITANVLRLRREWAQAEAKCSEVLQLDPDNATAHSLMGDILRDRGRVDDAIEWYKLALDHSPGNEADRKKLEALIDQVFPGRPRGRYGALRSVLRRWVKMAADEVRAARPVCPWAMSAAAILGAIMLTAFVAVLIARHSAPVSEPAPSPAGAGAFVATQAPGAEAAPPLQTAMPAEITGDIPALEQTVFVQLEGRAAEIDPNCSVTGVEVNPAQASVSVKFSMPKLWVPKDQRESLLRVGTALALAAATADAAFAAVTVRGSTRSAAEPERLAMVADASGETVRSAGDANAAARPEELFDSVWWRSELVESGRDEAVGEP